MYSRLMFLNLFDYGCKIEMVFIKMEYKWKKSRALNMMGRC